MKIYLHLNHPTEAFRFKTDHVQELHNVFPSLDIVQVDSTEALAGAVADADFVAAWHFPAELYQRASRLKAVFTPAAGREWVSSDPSNRVPTHYGTFHGMLMAESLLSMVLYFNRKLGLLESYRREKRWSHEGLSDCRSLSVQRALVIGYGNIGRACARGLSAIGCNVTGVRRKPEKSDITRDVREVVRFEDVEAHLRKADHVVLVLPGDTETTNIFTRDHFEAMKKSAYLYNLGRGNCYREEDLVGALKSGSIAGAGLDVFAEEPLPRSSELWELPNALIMPHASAVYDDYMDLFLAELMEKLQPMLTD
jgi:phosphoglycerate dehydrogenase-like enzyme